MKELKLIGGPADGLVIDLDHICNQSDEYCPVHGFSYGHQHKETTKGAREDVVKGEDSYDMNTGQYLGPKPA